MTCRSYLDTVAQGMLRLNSRRERLLWLIILGILMFCLCSAIFNVCNVSPGQHVTSISFGMRKETSPTALAPKEGEARVYRWKNGKWIRIPDFCSKSEVFQSAKLRTPFGPVKMYIHDTRKDIHVSGSIKRSGMWEAHGIFTMIKHLSKDPNMGFLDLGSQLGTYALVAAKMGRRVVAVDPLVENVLRLCKTVQGANMTDRMTILFTALSDSYRPVTFRRYKGNIGGTHIENVGFANFDNDDNYNDDFINTVHLDDILPFVDFSKAFIKIDVENHEYEALKEGVQLLTTKDIRGILMEWFQIKTTDKGRKLKNFLTNHSFRAVNPNRGTVLFSNYRRWPNDILWVKKL